MWAIDAYWAHAYNKDDEMPWFPCYNDSRILYMCGEKQHTTNAETSSNFVFGTYANLLRHKITHVDQESRWNSEE